jgi:hypothetical protein
MMKFKFLIQPFVLILISTSLFAQKPITPDVEVLQLHLSDYKNFDARTKQLLSSGYTKIDWPIAQKDQWLKNSTYKLIEDTTETILEIIHGDNNEVFQVNMYLGFTQKKWATFSDIKKMNISTNIFFYLMDLINKEYGTSQNGQRKVFGTYKVTDYEVPERFLSGLDDGDLGYFASWGPFMEYPIDLENYNAQYIIISVCDAKARTDYYKATKK